MRVGDTFRRAVSSPGFDKNRHLWIVLSDPTAYPDELITVFFTTLQPRRDQTCVVESGEHPFIVHKSIIAYDLAEIRKRSDLLSLVSRGEFILSDGADIRLVERIRLLLDYSPMSPYRIKDIAKKQGFGLPFRP